MTENVVASGDNRPNPSWDPVQEFDLVFADAVLSSMSSNLLKYGQPRLQLAQIGVSDRKSIYTLPYARSIGQKPYQYTANAREHVIRRSQSSSRTLGELATDGAYRGLADTLDLAGHVLNGVARHFSEHSHPRLNLREFGVNDTDRLAFGGLLHETQGTLHALLLAGPKTKQ